MPTLSKPSAITDAPEVNLQGQRLGRKGQQTRERILAAALSQLEGPQDTPVTLTSVAREASVGMTTLYLYFPDLASLVLAALHAVMDTADAAFVDRLRARWPDDSLDLACLDFLRAHYQFWRRHARILHMRNSFADAGDLNFFQYRNAVSTPLIDLLVLQMDGQPGLRDSPCVHSATVMLTCFERLATVATNPNFQHAAKVTGAMSDEQAYVDRLICAEAELGALTIRRRREFNSPDAAALGRNCQDPQLELWNAPPLPSGPRA